MATLSDSPTARIAAKEFFSGVDEATGLYVKPRDEVLLAAPIHISSETFLREFVKDKVKDSYVVHSRSKGDPTGKFKGFPATLREINRFRGNHYYSISTFYQSVSADEFWRLYKSRQNTKGLWTRKEAAHGGTQAIVLDDVSWMIGGKGFRGAALVSKVQPSIIVETSVDNYTAIYLLKYPEEDAKKVIALQNGIIAAGLVDDANGMRDPTRFFRFNGENQKPHAQGTGIDGGYWKVRTMLWEPHSRWTIDELAEAMGVSLIPEKRKEALYVPPQDRGPRERAFDDLLDAAMCLGLSPSPANANGWHEMRCPGKHTVRDREGNVIGSTQGPTNTPELIIHEPSSISEWWGGFKCFHDHHLEDEESKRLLDSGIEGLSEYLKRHFLYNLMRPHYSIKMSHTEWNRWHDWIAENYVFEEGQKGERNDWMIDPYQESRDD